VQSIRRHPIAAGNSTLAAGLAEYNESGQTSLDDFKQNSEPKFAADGTTAEAVSSRFKDATVHGTLEEIDRNAYETFEARLDAYITALKKGRDIATATAAFADASQYAQYLLVDSAEEFPLGLDLARGAGSSSGGTKKSGGTELNGDRNVIERIPDDADHVIDVNTVAFEPKQLTVLTRDTVASAYNAATQRGRLRGRDFGDCRLLGVRGVQTGKGRMNWLKEQNRGYPVRAVAHTHLQNDRDTRVLLRPARGRRHDGVSHCGMNPIQEGCL